MYLRLFPGHLRLADPYPVRGNMDILHPADPYISCNSRTGIPSGIRLGRIVHLHIHHILTAVSLKQIRDVPLKRRVSIHMAAQALSVQPHLRQHIRSFKMKDRSSVLYRVRIYPENFLIPAGSRPYIAP